MSSSDRRDHDVNSDFQSYFQKLKLKNILNFVANMHANIFHVRGVGGLGPCYCTRYDDTSHLLPYMV